MAKGTSRRSEWMRYCKTQEELFADQDLIYQRKSELAGHRTNRILFSCLLGERLVAGEDWLKIARANEPRFNATVAKLQCDKFFIRIGGLLEQWRSFDNFDCDSCPKNTNCRAELDRNLMHYLKMQNSFSELIIFSANCDWGFFKAPINKVLPELEEFEMQSDQELFETLATQSAAASSIDDELANLEAQIKIMKQMTNVLRARYEGTISDKAEREFLFSSMCNSWITAQNQLAVMTELKMAYATCSCAYCKMGHEAFIVWNTNDKIVKNLAPTTAVNWEKLPIGKGMPYPGICDLCGTTFYDFSERVPTITGHSDCDDDI